MTHTPFRRSASAVLLVSATALAGCATTSAKPPVIAYDDPPREIAATPAAEPPRAVEVVTVPEPLPLPGQLKPVAAGAVTCEPADPRRRVGAANAAARVQPVRDGFLNAIQQYPWTDGALYQVYAAPGQVTDIALQEGEQLVGPGPVAAGDTVRWIIGDTVSGSGATARVHILVKPTRPDLSTNLGLGVLDLAAVGKDRDRRGDGERRKRAFEAVVRLHGQICDGGHINSPWLPGDHPGWRLPKGPGAAVTAAQRRANPAQGLTA